MCIRDSYHASADPAFFSRIVALIPAVSPGRASSQAPVPTDELRGFLEGLPQRYLSLRPPEQIAAHFRMAMELGDNPVQLAYRTVRQLNEITLVTRDRPGLFADMAGVLSAWGMNIVKADAFSNAASIIVDSFQFTDTYRTLELNHSEIERFHQNIRDALSHKISIEELLQSRKLKPARPKVSVETRLEFDNEASSHLSLIHI